MRESFRLSSLFWKVPLLTTGRLFLFSVALWAVQEALKALCGVEDEAREFEASDVRRLYENGYTNTLRLEAATREGLRESGLPSALIDIILRAQGACLAMCADWPSLRFA